MAATPLPWPRPSVRSSPKRRRMYNPIPPMLSYNRSRVQITTKTLSASFDSFSDKEFSKEMEHKFLQNQSLFDAEFPERDVIIPANIERKANSMDIPVSLRMIKRKKQWREGLIGAGESALCSVKKAFSSMVFIIRELHSHTLKMREILFYEDLQGILANVQKEIHASFVWLFQKVFSHTPALMIHVMLLLANYSVYSMSSHAITSPPLITEEVSVVEDQTVVRKLNLLPSSNGKTASVGGSGGGGGKCRPVASGTDGDGRFDESNYYRSDDVLFLPSNGEEAALWDSIVDEVARMEAVIREESLDHETMKRFVSPVMAKIESDDRSEQFRTELQYQTELAQEPNNVLLLANYAQFLYVVVRDYDRAEGYFKKATEGEPKDAEALNKYANFLWLARNDLWGAEEAYLEAISAEPGNSYYAANYAHFLWNTGGQDTCFPLESGDSITDA